jgi:hypothetical protein
MAPQISLGHITVPKPLTVLRGRAMLRRSRRADVLARSPSLWLEAAKNSP